MTSEKKKKLYIFTDDPTAFGGVEEFVRRVVDLLEAYSPTVLLYNAEKKNQKEFTGNATSVNDVNKRTFFERIWGSRKGGITSKNFLRRGFSLLRDIPQIRRQTHELLKDGNNLIILNSIEPMLLFFSKKVRRNNEFILVQHNSSKEIMRIRYYFGGIFKNYKIKLFNRYVQNIVLLAPQEVAEITKHLDISEKRVQVIRHSLKLIPLDEIKYNQSKTIIMIARMATAKRIDRAIDIARIMPDFNFIFYGAGPELDNLKLYAKNLPNIEFRGYTKRPMVSWQEGSITLITSDWEGYSISGIEACSLGIPIVVLNTYAAAHDLVNDGQSGIVINDYSPEKFEKAIRKIYENYEHFHKGALAHRELYDEDTIKREWNNFIHEVMTISTRS